MRGMMFEGVWEVCEAPQRALPAHTQPTPAAWLWPLAHIAAAAAEGAPPPLTEAGAVAGHLHPHVPLLPPPGAPGVFDLPVAGAQIVALAQPGGGTGHSVGSTCPAGAFLHGQQALWGV